MCKKLQILIDFHYTEKRKSLSWDESVRRRHTLTLGSSIEQDIDTHSVYGFETPMMEHRTTAAANGKSHSSPYLYVLLVFAHCYNSMWDIGIKIFPEVTCICTLVNDKVSITDPLAKLRHRWEGNIKMNLHGIGCGWGHRLNLSA